MPGGFHRRSLVIGNHNYQHSGTLHAFRAARPSIYFAQSIAVALSPAS